MTVFERILADASALVADPRAWWSIAIAAAFIAVSVSIGWAIAARTRLVSPTSPIATVVGIGLPLGLMTLVASYAAIRSGGASVFVPTLAAVLLAIGAGDGGVPLGRPRTRLVVLVVGLCAAAGLVALLYGSTLAPSPRGGSQPVEFMDEPYYAFLGSWLDSTGRESLFGSAGFGDLIGQPASSWYHWGEIWLAALALRIPAVDPMAARYLVALPVTIVATVACVAAATASRVSHRFRRRAALLAAVATALIAPVPLVLANHFDWWARAIGFSATLYGLAYPIASLGVLLWPAFRSKNRAMPYLAAALAAALLASHVLVAATAAVAVVTAAAWTAKAGKTSAPRLWTARSMAGAALGGAIALTWGFATGHALGSDGRVESILPFSDAWSRALLLTVAGAGVLVVGPALAIAARRRSAELAALAAGGVAAVATGAFVWGLRLADFNSFHVYFGALAVIATPIAVIATVVVTLDYRSARRTATATLLTAVLVAQCAIGLAATVQRLYEFGPGHYDAIPTAALDEIRGLDPEAKLAYGCGTFEEIAVWDARLISITAHTGRPVIPMCYQADIVGPQLGAVPDPSVENPFFRSAPQRELYPSAGARPNLPEILRFLHAHAIGYVWEDRDHPNVLVPGAEAIFRSGPFAIYRVP